MCEKLTDSLSFVGATTMPAISITVIYALLNVGGVWQGQSIPVHSTYGSVSIAPLQLARVAGAEVCTTVGNEDKVERFSN